MLRATVFIIPDSENYYLPGFQLARATGFDLEPRRAPVYPVLIALLIRSVGQDLASLAFVQHLLGLLTAASTYWLTRLTFGRPAGVIAGLLVALNGSLLISEQTVSSEATFTLLLSLAALASVLALRSLQPCTSAVPSSWLALAAGIVLALAALTRPVGLGLLPVVPLMLATARPGWRRAVRLCALYLAGAALVLLPWMMRNFVTLRVFSTEGVFGQTLVGRTVRHDRFRFVDSAIASDPDVRRQRARELMQDAANRRSFITPLRRRLMQELGLTEPEANRLMRDLAVEAIARQPDYFARGTGRFFGSLALGWTENVRDAWQSRRDPDSREEWESHPEIAPLLGAPSTVQERQLVRAEQIAGFYQPGRFGPILLALFSVGVLTAAVRASRRPALVPAAWAIALLLVSVALVGPVLRYRYPAEPFLAVLAGGGLATVWHSVILFLQRIRPARALLKASPSRETLHVFRR